VIYQANNKQDKMEKYTQTKQQGKVTRFNGRRQVPQEGLKNKKIASSASRRSKKQENSLRQLLKFL